MAITIVLAIVSAAALKPAEAAGLRNGLMNDIQANGVDLSEDDQGGNTETGDELLDAKDEVIAKNLIEISKSKARDALLAVKAKGNVPYLCTDSSQRCCCTCDCGFHRSSLGDKMKWRWSRTYGRRRAQNTHPNGCAYKYWTTSCGANGQPLPGQTAVNNCCHLPKATRCTDSDTCLGSSWAGFTCSYSTSSGTNRAWCTKYPQQVGKCCRKSCANCGEEDEQLQNTSDTTELLGVLEATGLMTKVADAAGVGWDCG